MAIFGFFALAYSTGGAPLRLACEISSGVIFWFSKLLKIAMFPVDG